MNLREETLAQEEVYLGKIFKVERSLVRLPNGMEAFRDVVRHPGAVAILARPSLESVILVRPVSLCHRGGTVGDTGWETRERRKPQRCVAVRELQEETGYSPGKLRKLASFYTAPGFSSEFMYLYEAWDLVPQAGQTDPDEFVEVHKVLLQDALAWIEEGRIRDAKDLCWSPAGSPREVAVYWPSPLHMVERRISRGDYDARHAGGRRTWRSMSGGTSVFTFLLFYCLRWGLCLVPWR
ncbi:MAG: NUDIX hydrolase [bacterium]